MLTTLRTKPEKTRQRILFVVIGIVALVLFFILVLTFGDRRKDGDVIGREINSIFAKFKNTEDLFSR